MSKEAWLRAFEERRAELEDAGMPEKAAYYQAAEDAQAIMEGRLAYAADMARLRAKDGDA
jgi:hypothetical protein